MHRVIGLLSENLWAVQPEVLETWCRIVEARAAGDQVEIEAAVPAKGKRPAGADLDVRHGVAVIPVVGSLTKRATLFDCGQAYGAIRQDVEAAMADPSVKAILLDVDSPGGVVSGVKELADFLTEAGKAKPIYAYADGLMASAAYWLGSAAREIAAPETAQVGSIGVLMVHVDRSQANERSGIKTTYITAGKFKAVGNDSEPLGDEAKSVLQERADGLYSIFLGDVARNRGVPLDQAEAMADGKVFLAAQAKDMGLIDLVMSKEQFINRIAEGHIMDLKELKANHPELVGQLRAEVEQELRATAETDRKAAEKGGRDHVLGLVGAAFGEEQRGRIALAVEAGVTAEQLTAVKGLFPQAGAKADQTAADKTSRQQILAGLHETAPDPLKPTKGEDRPAEGDPKAEWDKDADLRAEFGGEFARYEAYLQAACDGRAKILGQK